MVFSYGVQMEKETNWSNFLQVVKPELKPKVCQWLNQVYDYLSQPSYTEGTCFFEISMFAVVTRIANYLDDAHCLAKVELTDIDSFFEEAKDYVRDNYENILKAQENKGTDLEAVMVGKFSKYISDILISKCNSQKIVKNDTSERPDTQGVLQIPESAVAI